MEIGGGEYERQVIDKPDSIVTESENGDMLSTPKVQHTTIVRVRNEDCCTNGVTAKLFDVASKQLTDSASIGSRCQARPSPKPLRHSSELVVACDAAPR